MKIQQIIFTLTHYVFFEWEGREGWMKKGGRQVMMSCPDLNPWPIMFKHRSCRCKPWRLGDGIAAIQYSYMRVYTMMMSSCLVHFNLVWALIQVVFWWFFNDVRVNNHRFKYRCLCLFIKALYIWHSMGTTFWLGKMNFLSFVEPIREAVRKK